MFSSTTSSTGLRMARSSRQSGLKKPRPLRSVSLQEQPAENEVQKFTPERQLSSPASNYGMGNDFHVSEGISAMSALIAAEAGADTANCPTQVMESTSPPEKRSSFHRQDSSSSYNSCFGSESGSSFHSMSRQNSLSTENNTTLKPRDFPPTSFIRSNSSEETVKDIAVDVNSNNIRSYQDANSPRLPWNEEDSNFPLITLLTAQGERLILTGTCMPAILNASRILVREKFGKVVGMKLEDLNDDTSRQSQTQTKTESSSPLPQPEEKTAKEKKSNHFILPLQPREREKKVIRYSKDDLLALSECNVARAPPANWNILIHTHSDCCLPADKMREYFEAIDFHVHDGTLVTEDRRIRDRRD